MWFASLLQVDAVALRHPDVAEAVTFAVADALLGQVAHAAVVLKAQSALSPQDASYSVRVFLKKWLHVSKVC